MVNLNVDPANAPLESVADRYSREWLQLQDDRKVRGYDLRSSERRSRDFVDPATVAVASATTTVDYDGKPYQETTFDVTGTVGAKFDNTNGTDTSALVAGLPDRGEAY